MKRIWLFLICFPLALHAYSPESSLEELFAAVQMEPVFSDSKTFVDSIPLCCPEQIVHLYQCEQPEDLKAFVETYFELPNSICVPDKKELTMEAYVDSAWDYLLRSSLKACGETTTLLPLPAPYIVAGDRFREMYYWDSFFSMLGLTLSGRCDLVEGMLTDFAYLIDMYGFVPNGNRSYYLTRSQPPFFSLMVRLSANPEKYLKQLEREHTFWMEERLVEGTLLNHYSDACATPRPESYREDVLNAEAYPEEERPAYFHNVRATAESGWDFSSRWLDESGDLITTHLAPIDLNCLLYHEERLLAELCAALGYEECALSYRRLAAQRRCTIQKTFWDPEKEFFFDYNYVKGERSSSFTLAGLFPLLFDIATDEQAAAIVKTVKERFLFPGGLVTTLEESGEQWDYPNGWAPLQWMAVRGLSHYGYKKLADEIVRRWLKVNGLIYAQTGTMVEKYNVVEPGKLAEGGEYPLQAGFGWTNGVALDFFNWLSKKSPARFRDKGDSPESCIQMNE